LLPWLSAVRPEPRRGLLRLRPAVCEQRRLPSSPAPPDALRPPPCEPTRQLAAPPPAAAPRTARLPRAPDFLPGAPVRRLSATVQPLPSRRRHPPALWREFPPESFGR